MGREQNVTVQANRDTVFAQALIRLTRIGEMSWKEISVGEYVTYYGEHIVICRKCSSVTDGVLSITDTEHDITRRVYPNEDVLRELTYSILEVYDRTVSVMRDIIETAYMVI